MVHRREVFAPVVTLVPYDGDADTALRMVRAGGGGLLCVVYSDDGTGLDASYWALSMAQRFLGLQESCRPGGHPGDGVAGSCAWRGRRREGEELGGVRGMSFCMQRTVIQADRGMLGKLLRLAMPLWCCP